MYSNIGLSQKWYSRFIYKCICIVLADRQARLAWYRYFYIDRFLSILLYRYDYIDIFLLICFLYIDIFIYLYLSIYKTAVRFIGHQAEPQQRRFQRRSQGKILEKISEKISGEDLREDFREDLNLTFWAVCKAELYFFGCLSVIGDRGIGLHYQHQEI